MSNSNILLNSKSDLTKYIFKIIIKNKKALTFSTLLFFSRILYSFLLQKVEDLAEICGCEEFFRIKSPDTGKELHTLTNNFK